MDYRFLFFNGTLVAGRARSPVSYDKNVATAASLEKTAILAFFLISVDIFGVGFSVVMDIPPTAIAI